MNKQPYTADQAIYCMARAQDIDFITARAMGECYRDAVDALGPDLMDSSPVDLLADNFPDVPLATIQKIVNRAGIN